MGERADLSRSSESVSVGDYDQKRPEQIRDDIRQTRANLSQTVNTLQARLDPDRLKGEVRDATVGRIEYMANNMGRKARRMRHSVVDTIRENPVPAALVGLGLGWLLVEGMSDSSDEYYEERYYPLGEGAYSEPVYEVEPYGTAGDEYRRRSQVRERFDETREQARHVAGRTREQAEEMGYRAKERAAQLGRSTRDRAEHIGGEIQDRAEYLSDEARERAAYMQQQARYQTRRARNQFDWMMDENPLAVGAAALALGVVAGLSAPGTRYEDRIMGPTRDELVGAAQDQAKDTLQRAERVAEEAAYEAKEAAKETAEKEAERQNLKSPDAPKTSASSGTTAKTGTSSSSSKPKPTT